MKQNNRRTKLKAIVAVVLVMASLFAMASLVSAGFVEEVFSEVCELMTTSSAGQKCEHLSITETRTKCNRCSVVYVSCRSCDTCGQCFIIEQHQCNN